MKTNISPIKMINTCWSCSLMVTL